MTVVGGTLIALGVVLTLLAAVGILRLPDLLIRMNAATKAASLGVACVLAGVAFLDPSVEAAVKVTLAIVLQFATAPIAGHVIGRAAYNSGTPLWGGTLYDEMADSGRFPRRAEALDSGLDFQRDPPPD